MAAIYTYTVYCNVFIIILFFFVGGRIKIFVLHVAFSVIYIFRGNFSNVRQQTSTIPDYDFHCNIFQNRTVTKISEMRTVFSDPCNCMHNSVLRFLLAPIYKVSFERRYLIRRHQCVLFLLANKVVWRPALSCPIVPLLD